MKKFDFKEFKELTTKLLKQRDVLKKEWSKEIKKELKPYFKTIEESDYVNGLDEFYFILKVTTKKGMMLDFSIEDDNNACENDWKAYVHIYDIPDGFEKKYKYVGDCCIFKNNDVNKAIKFLQKLAEEY